MLATTSTASYTSLLEIIQDKEKELSRIRQTANVVAEEEKLAAQRKFAELEEDFHHNLELLRDKDETIQRLERCIVQMERDHSDSLKIVEERCKEHATLEIAKATSKAEEQFRKKFRMEYEEKLSASERETKKEYQMKLYNELQNQEVILSDKFDCVLTRLESEHNQQLNDVYRQLEQKEKDLIATKNASKTELRNVEARVILEAEARLEKTVSVKIKECEMQNEMKIRKVMQEKDQLVEEIRQLEHSHQELEIRNKDLLWKHDELLGVIQNLEQSYLEMMQDFEVDRKKWITQNKVLQEKSGSLEALLHQCKERHRKQLKDVEKKTQMKKKLLSREIRNLAKKLASTKEEKEEVEELMREKEEEGHSSKQQLKEKITSLSNECKELRRQINSCHGLISLAPSDESSWKDELKRTLKIKEDALTVAREEMRSRFEREMTLARDEFEKEIQGLVRERDNLIKQRDTMKRSIVELETDCTNVRTELSCLRQKLLQSESRENSKSTLRSLERQNVQLKETIKTMRREMESLIAASREHGTESEKPIQADDTKCSTKLKYVQNLETSLKNLTSEYDAIVNERDRLLEISSKLQTQIRRFREQCRCVKNTDDRSIDIDDLANSIWTGALNNQFKPKQATKASDRATRSQELYLKKKREGSNAPTQVPKAKIIRNWNVKED